MNHRPGPAVDAARAAAAPLAAAFADAGHRLYLVGGLVRDDLLGRVRADADYDLTTDARPDTIKHLIEPFADAVWTAGERFGTIACRIGGVDYEITTHRADAYDESSRKPIVEFGDNVHDDLARRDFTVNAMAVDLADGTLVDPFDGAGDLSAGRLRTPLDPEISFSDDPLRMLRAARFIATLGLEPNAALLAAVSSMRTRMEIVSVERVHDELQKMLLLSDPQPGFAFLASTGLLADVLPAIAAVGLDPDVVGSRPRLVVPESAERWAALLLDAPTAERTAELRRLKPSGELARSVAWLTDAEPWLTSGGAPATPEALRRAAAAAPKGQSLEARLAFVRALGPADDPHLDAVDAELARLRRTEPDLDAPEPPLSGVDVAEALGIDFGPLIGQAHAVLLEHRFEHGPMRRDEALDVVRRWWAERSG
ncbi:MAG: CCA tRNA nucleotidyltransferase [Actinomycetota bacterium]